MSADGVAIDWSLARILIVDDEPANLLLLERLLKTAGYTGIVRAGSGQEALALFEAQPFDLVLLDLNMPGMTGFEVLSALREHCVGDWPPVLMLTAQTDAKTRVTSLELGARDFVGKPFERTELLSRIRNQLEVRLLQRQLKSQNEQLEARVRQRTTQLRDLQLEIVRRLGLAAEYRDNETGNHILRMSKFAAALGRKIGLAEDEVDMLLNASPMHDIGKIGIPDHILLKPGRFTDEERAIMMEHAAIGARILSGSESPLLKAAQEIALTHHERWDGQGYPNGLAGEDIPLFGRITAICDVFDALTSCRPYKKAWPIEDAVRFLEEHAGTHFDPHLVPPFIAILPEILAIRSRHEDADT